MPIEYESDAGLQGHVDNLIVNETMPEFQPIRQHEVKVAARLKINLDDNDEPRPCRGEPVSIIRLNELQKHFADADYVLTCDYGFWIDGTTTEMMKLAAIHKGLMRINVKTSRAGTKLGLRRPDIVEFRETIVRFGAVNPHLTSLMELLQAGAQATQQVASAA